MMPSSLGGRRTYIGYGPSDHRGYRGDFMFMKQWPGVTTYVDPNTARKKPDGAPAGSPYGLPALVKHQTTDVIATKLMLDFFDKHQ
jgi:hypothetical protein